MKRLLLFLCLLPVLCQAQPSSQVIAKGIHCLLSRTMGDYGIVVSSVSDWDSPITIELGKDKDMALTNLARLIEQYESSCVGADLEMRLGLRTYHFKRLPAALNIGHGYYGGDINITGKQLKKFYKALQTYEED